jgi:hypothetical protein
MTSLGAVENAAAILEGPLPDLGVEDRRQLVSTVAARCPRSPPRRYRSLSYTTRPNLGHALLDLEPRLTRATETTIAGAQALASTPPRLSSPRTTASVSRLADASTRGASQKRAVERGPPPRG